MKAVFWISLLAFFGMESVQAGTNAWTRLGQNGAVTSFAIDPQNPANVYAATGIGLFKSSDGGENWIALNPGPPCCISTLVMNPQDPATIYGVSGGSGIFRSADGGATWSAVNFGLPVDVTSLAIDPRNPTTLYSGSAQIGRAHV